MNRPAPAPAPAPGGRELVLASASPGRLGVLRRAGFAPRQVVSGVDETPPAGCGPAQVTEALALRKARAVAAVLDHPALVVGADSLLEIDGDLVGKPAGADEAARWWRARRNRSGVLHTGHALIDTVTGREATAVSSTTVRFGDPSDEEIDRYVATGEPLAVAGAFMLEGLAAPFLAGIDGDPLAVIGVSPALLRTLAGSLGLRLVDFWV